MLLPFLSTSPNFSVSTYLLFAHINSIPSSVSKFLALYCSTCIALVIQVGLFTVPPTPSAFPPANIHSFAIPPLHSLFSPLCLQLTAPPPPQKIYQNSQEPFWTHHAFPDLTTLSFFLPLLLLNSYIYSTAHATLMYLNDINPYIFHFCGCQF